MTDEEYLRSWKPRPNARTPAERRLLSERVPMTIPEIGEAVDLTMILARLLRVGNAKEGALIKGMTAEARVRTTHRLALALAQELEQLGIVVELDHVKIF